MAKEYISGTFAEDGSSSSIIIKERGIAFVGGAGGTSFGSGTVSVEAKGPDNQWYTTQETFAASDVKSLSFLLPTEVRLTMAGSTTPDCDYSVISDSESYRD